MKQILLTFTCLTVLSACAVSPKPMSVMDHSQRSRQDLVDIYKDQQELAGAVTLEEAIARGLAYNLENRMAMMEEVLQDNQLSLANFAMLPKLAANAGYTNKNRFSASRSISFLTRTQSLEPSYSEDRDRLTSDLSFSWNILDFGVGYYQAKQQADRTMIAVERRRRVVNNLVKQIRTAYWKAASAEQILPRITPILQDVEKAIKNAKIIEEEQISSPVASLEYQRDLLTLLTQLKTLKSSLSIAKSELASLMNLPMGTQYTLDITPEQLNALPEIQTPLKAIQQYSLVYRPELREEDYQTRIDLAGVNKEILRVFPNLSFLTSLQYDSNSLLLFDNWRELGMRATWNLMNVLQAPRAIDAAKSQVDVSKLRRMALSVSILTQVTVSYSQYQQAIEAYDVANKLTNIENKMLEYSEGSLDAGNELQRIQQRVKAIASELNRDSSLAEAQLAFSNLLSSIGVDLVPAEANTADLKALEAYVGDSLNDLNTGNWNDFLQLPDATNTKNEGTEINAEVNS